MSKNQLLPEQVQEVLTEESLQQVEKAFKQRADLLVEAALTKQDELYATKLKDLITAIDKDHTAKLKRVVEAVDQSNATKLLKVVKKYEKEVNRDATNFKQTLVESISNYLEEYIDEAIPTQAIEEAVKNKTAISVLSNLRSVLAVDTALMSESVKDAVLDGKKQIDELQAEVEKLRKENTLVKEAYTKTKSNLLLETKTVGLSDKRKEYIKRVLGDKSPKFIEENFDYTLKLFDKKEKERIDVIKEQAFTKRTVKTDVQHTQSPQPIIENRNPYVDELRRMK
jgi:hypothetical protein